MWLESHVAFAPGIVSNYWIVQLANSDTLHFRNWSFTTPYASNIASLVLHKV